MCSKKSLCQLRQYKGNCLLQNAFKCVLCYGEMWWPGLWCRLLLGDLLYSDDFTCLDRGQTDNSTLCTFRRHCIELKKQNKKQILQQIDSTCVLCLRDTLQMTNKQNEPNNSRFGRHIAGRSWSLWKSTGLHRETGGEHDLLTLAVMVPDLRNYGPHNFNAMFIALQIWRLLVQLQQPESLYMATANCIQAAYSSGGLQNHFHCLFFYYFCLSSCSLVSFCGAKSHDFSA